MAFAIMSSTAQTRRPPHITSLKTWSSCSACTEMPCTAWALKTRVEEINSESLVLKIRKNGPSPATKKEPQKAKAVIGTRVLSCYLGQPLSVYGARPLTWNIVDIGRSAWHGRLELIVEGWADLPHSQPKPWRGQVRKEFFDAKLHILVLYTIGFHSISFTRTLKARLYLKLHNVFPRRTRRCIYQCRRC